MERVVYKPKLGTRVYCIDYFMDRPYILIDSIGFLGKDSFLLKENPVVLNKLLEWRYEDFGETWFETRLEAEEEYDKLSR